MSVILGTRIGSTPFLIDNYPHLYDRTIGDYPLERYEEYVRQTSPLANHRTRGHRGPYAFMNQAWPANTVDSRPSRDAAEHRTVFASHKAASGRSWSTLASGADDAQINARRVELEAWWPTVLAADPLAVLFWTLHHEPDGDETSASGTSDAALGRQRYREAIERIWTIWTANLPIAEIAQDGTVLSGGMALAGPNIAGGTYSESAAAFQTTLDNWYPANWSWFWANGHMMSFDPYNSGPTWRLFSEHMAGSVNQDGRPGTSRVSPFTFWEQRKNAMPGGRPLLLSVWETGCQERNEVDPTTGNPRYTSNSTLSANMGITTRPAWLHHFGEWLSGQWGSQIHSILWWDSVVTPPDGRGPWMLDSAPTTAQQLATWEAWVEILQLPVFGYTAQPPPDPGSFVPGASKTWHRLARVL